MLNAMVDWAVRNRLLVVLSLIAALVGSAFSLEQLNLDAFPDVTNIQVQVNTEAPGLAAEEVEQLITYPIEAAMYSLPDVEEVRSISKTGLSVITVVFKDGTDIYFARQLVFEQLQAARENVPEGVGTPEMGINTSGLGMVFQYVLLAEEDSKLDALRLRSLNDWVVKLLLLPVDGVTDVLSFGGDVLQYQVQLDPARMLSYHLSTDQVIEAIEANNRNAGGWYVNRGAEQLVLRAVGWVRSDADGLTDIGNVPVKEVDGVVVKVKDLAQLRLGGEIRQGAVTMTTRDAQGRPQPRGEVLAGIVFKRMGANTNATIEGVYDRLPLIAQALPDGVTLYPYYDQADLINKAVATVTNALLQAFVLLIIVLAIFLMNLRATVLVLLSIPLSIGLALTVMAYWGISANLMSLGGLAIAIGMMVDGTVVVMENIFSHLTKPEAVPAEAYLGVVQSRQRRMNLLIQAATHEVTSPVFFAVMIIAVVFSPLFTLEGVESKLFQPMAVSIVAAMLASLLVALVVIPALASYSFKQAPRHGESPVLQPIAWVYRRVLRGALKRRALVVGSAAVLFVLAMAIMTQLGTEFVPELEEGTLNVRTTLAPSSSLKTSVALAPKLEAILMEFPEVTYALSLIGRAEVGGDPEPVSNIETYVGLKPAAEWTSARNRHELQTLMEEKLSVHPGLLFSFSQPIATRVDELLSGVKAQLAVKLFGPDLDVLARKGREIEALVHDIKGTRGVSMEKIAGEAQLVVRPDREALARYGMAVEEIVSLVSDGIGGVSAGQVIKGNERYDIFVRLEESVRRSASAIRDLLIESSNGSWVRLGEVASVEIEAGPPQIRRDDVQRRVVIQSNVEDRDMGSLVDELKARISREIDLPPGYNVVFGGQYTNQERAQARLMIVVPTSLALILLLLYFAFGSLGQAALIMINIPLALIGGIIALWLSGQYLSVPSSIGFIALFGVAVLNGVVMVTSINRRFTENRMLGQAIEEGAHSRLRPVLMTAITTALGLIPLLLATGVGSEIQRPMATVVIGGLVSSTLLTLLVIPSLYPWFSRHWVRRNLKVE
ncbi:MAG: CusA/CzcA family heavy metal efflux RND transporter [Nitrospira sp.]|nr:CusA/CzcA family heavy metal efflux RND transporter [Nitrospira sp.]MDE0406049.1 CusA/CzcA family heavy metal efflux RND transporter [Nitrospira sp.]MDE0486783.1 CusA/CzcA family heavy metal efflux RND transporter [Nitrospira sp.]